MEAERRSLREIVQEQGPLPVRDAVGWITRASKTLAFIHDQGRVHGAICADALLLADTDCNAEGALCHPSDLPEAPEYHSRARSLHDELTVEDDVWALSVTLFFAVTGVLPYPRGVSAWLDAGNKQSPPAAMYGGDLSGMDAVLGLLLDPGLLPDEIPTAIMLANQLAMFSPATAPLPPLQLQTPHAGPLDMDATLQRMAPMHSASERTPALPSPDDDTSLPSHALLMSLPPAPPDGAADEDRPLPDAPPAPRRGLLLLGVALLLFAAGFLGAWLCSR
jgi:serine/threonine protein kinase